MRKEIVTLQAQVIELNKVIFAEREQSLQRFMKAQNRQGTSDTLMSIIVNADSSELQKRLMLKKTLAIDPIIKDQGNSVTNYVFEEQQELYKENLSLLQTLNWKYVKQLEEQLEKAQEHASVLLDMYTIYRKQLFTQKMENCKDHREFLKSADTLTKANCKHVLVLEQNLIEITRKSVNEEAKGILNSLLRQIERRDKLVSILRQQQMKLSLQIEELQKESQRKRDIYNEETRKLKEHLRREREKYNVLEQRRAFDLEGFSTDIKQCKKEMMKIKQKVSGKAKLVEKIDDMLLKVKNVNKV
ncbi:coiled-coil domain-containing protein 77-like [Photinus pyralis]|nr:coiled-coil domain-containing protein 77-like [Photinus pyralis]